MRPYFLGFVLFASVATADVPVPPAASQAEVNAGTLHTKFVAPDTLKNFSGGSATNALKQGPSGIYDASLVTNVQASVIVGTLPTTALPSNVVTNQMPVIQAGGGLVNGQLQLWSFSNSSYEQLLPDINGAVYTPAGYSSPSISIYGSPYPDGFFYAKVNVGSIGIGDVSGDVNNTSIQVVDGTGHEYILMRATNGVQFLGTNNSKFVINNGIASGNGAGLTNVPLSSIPTNGYAVVVTNNVAGKIPWWTNAGVVHYFLDFTNGP